LRHLRHYFSVKRDASDESDAIKKTFFLEKETLINSIMLIFR